RLVERAHPVMEKVLEADEQRRLEALLEARLHHVAEGDLLPALLERRDGDEAQRRDVEVTAPPAIDEVELLRVIGGPLRGVLLRSTGAAGRAVLRRRALLLLGLGVQCSSSADIGPPPACGEYGIA